jgi:hypothetical protein
MGLSSRARGAEIQWPLKQWLHGPMGWGLVCRAICCVSNSWGGEAFHELRVQSAKVSAPLDALPQPIVSSASQPSPSFTELMWSAALTLLPSWILANGC